MHDDLISARAKDRDKEQKDGMMRLISDISLSHHHLHHILWTLCKQNLRIKWKKTSEVEIKTNKYIKLLQVLSWH